MSTQKIRSKLNPKLEVTAYPGHFATQNCHSNYYIDITDMKHEHDLAREAAITIAKRYSYTKMVDTIICVDGSEVIGAFLADHMTQKGCYYINANRSMGVVPTEFDQNGVPVFRDNLMHLVSGKNIMLLISTVKSGKTIARTLESLKRFGAEVQGIAAVFSTTETLHGLPVYSLFTQNDLPEYVCADPENCLMCKSGRKIDAHANSYGIFKD